MAESLKAALVDIGGTLWPNSWPMRATDGEGRLARLRALLPDLPLESATELAADIITRSRDLNGGTVMVPELIRITPTSSSRYASTITMSRCARRW